MRKIFLAIVLVAGMLALSFTLAPTPYSFPELKFFPKMPASPANPVTVEGAELGRLLFYDVSLSADSSLSCGSCHKQEHAFTDGEQFSKGFKGQTLERNTMPLFNLAWNHSLFWDGRAKSIEEQVFHPVRAHNEMNLHWDVAAKRIRTNKKYKALFKAAFGTAKVDSMLISKAIAQFERTLISNRSRFDRALAGQTILTEDEREGFILLNDMTRGDCLHCHTTDADALGTTGAFSNNGLDDVKDPGSYKDKGRGAITGDRKQLGHFKIPSLRNLVFTAPYMHDGRFKTLEEVIDFYSSGVHMSANIDSKMGTAKKKGAHFTNLEKKRIIAFLKTLSDSAFVSDERFSDPYSK